MAQQLALALIFLIISAGNAFTITAARGRLSLSPLFSSRVLGVASSSFSSSSSSSSSSSKEQQQQNTVTEKEDGWTSLSDVWVTLATLYPNKTALVDPARTDDKGSGVLTFSQLLTAFERGAQGFQKLGLRPGEIVAQFSENSHRWLVADQAVMKANCANAVRGSTAPLDELLFIYTNSGASALIVDNLELLCLLTPGLSAVLIPPLFVLVLHPPKGVGDAPQSGAGMHRVAGLPGEVRVVNYDEWQALADDGTPAPAAPPAAPPAAAAAAVSESPNTSLATIVYTSGTTSRPKGVRLSHAALLHQIRACTFSDTGQLEVKAGDTVLSILPPWHVFERTCEYCVLARGCKLVYSSLSTFKADLHLWRPQFVFAVPRLIQHLHKSVQAGFKRQTSIGKMVLAVATLISTLYQLAYRTWTNTSLSNQPTPNRPLGFVAAMVCLVLFPFKKLADWAVWRKVLEGFGGRMRALVSGGSSLPQNVDSFFAMVGLRVIAGYGLTETGPIVCNRRSEHNVIGSVGEPLDGVTFKICKERGGPEVPSGESGVLFVKTPSIMLGYHNDKASTAAAFDKDGYFDTGDIATLDPATKQIVITGRQKDTIVLSNGENVAPAPIEDTILKSPLFDQAMLVGQDMSYLSALLVLNPHELGKRRLVQPSLVKQLETTLGLQGTTLGPIGDVKLLQQVANELNVDESIRTEVRQELEKMLGGNRAFEKVQSFKILLEPFSVETIAISHNTNDQQHHHRHRHQHQHQHHGNGQLTQTLKLKRGVIAKEYARAIEELYSPSDR